MLREYSVTISHKKGGKKEKIETKKNKGGEETGNNAHSALGCFLYNACNSIMLMMALTLYCPNAT